MNRSTTATVPAEARSRTRVGNKHDVPNDGFIHLAPKTHDISLIGEHIPDIAHLAADLEVAVNAAWSRRHDIRYSKVQVLLLRWKNDDLGVETELKDLQHVFTDLFNFGVATYEIPSEKPDKALKRRVFDFLDHDGVETLLILYYAGHAKTSLQANEAPLWFANRKPESPSLPSGGIQSMFEEADADVLLLYDCCHSAVTTACSPYKSHKGVTEVVAACGYEAIAPEVGKHSFTNALAEVLAAASKGKPFSIAELHTRVLSRLKCWIPSLVKDENGKRKEDPTGRLQYERQPRRTPIYSILCETERRRSIVLAPLKSTSTDTTNQSNGFSSNANFSPRSTPSDKLLGINTGAEKRKHPVDQVIDYPQVLLAIRLDKHELDLEAWKECLLRQLPPDAKEIKIEGIFGSFSSLLLLRIPVALWDVLPENPAYSFVGFVTTENHAILEQDLAKLADSCDIQRATAFETDGYENTTMYHMFKGHPEERQVREDWQRIQTNEAEVRQLLGNIRLMERKRNEYNESGMSEQAKEELSPSKASFEDAFDSWEQPITQELHSHLSLDESKSDSSVSPIEHKTRKEQPSEPDETLQHRRDFKSADTKDTFRKTTVHESHQPRAPSRRWDSFPMGSSSREATPTDEFNHLPLSPRDVISRNSSVYQGSDMGNSPRSLSPEPLDRPHEVVYQKYLERQPADPFGIPGFPSLPTPSVSSYSASLRSVPPSTGFLAPSFLSGFHSLDSALRDHTATLQHEVSVQKIALSSLQGEHHKLLAAFSRSQTRAEALQNKHAVSDAEIIKLMAENLELEREVEELVRSRHEIRETAVQEGSQYVRIVKRASELEQLAAEERRNCKTTVSRLEEVIEQERSNFKRTFNKHVGYDIDHEDLQLAGMLSSQDDTNVRRLRRKVDDEAPSDLDSELPATGAGLLKP